MADPPNMEHVHINEERLRHGWQRMLEKQGMLTIQDQQVLQEALELMRNDEVSVGFASSSSSPAFASKAAGWQATVPSGGAASSSAANAVAASVPGMSTLGGDTLHLLRAGRRTRHMKALTRVAARWSSGWLSRYGLALVLAIYVVFDRTSLLRSRACQRFCYGAGSQISHEAGGSSVLSESKLQGPLDRAQLRILQAATADIREPFVLASDKQKGDELLVPRVPIGRRLASSASASSSSSGGHESHPHEAMFFLCLALIVGTFVTHMLSLPLFKGLQQTVILFVIGVILSLVLEGFKLTKRMDWFGRSYSMWMEIDPHLLLFTLLPPLVTGDAMGIDTSVAKRVARQCMFLAGPGVCIAGFSAACFLKLYLPYKWPFLLCLTTGSILCATDPVAVVALLKDLGASPTLRVQIQGESLLNDGTAIVLYTIAYRMLSGESYDVADIVMFLVKMAIYAWGLGIVIGFFFFAWIKKANNRLNHHSRVIQVSLTICCAYSSFCIAEGGFHISGVLSTVAAAGVLAHKMWPEVVCKESMDTTWHMLEYLGNTLIFFLAGALSGKVMIRIKFVDYLHLVVIYIAVIIIRGGLFFGFRPLMKYLHADRHPVTPAEAAVMTWGGLRGAIGLALAIQVNVGRADNRISQDDADRVLFYTSGIAALTLIVNATTCPALVRKLGVTSLPETKRIMLSILNRQMLELCGSRTKPGRVREALTDVLNEVEEHIQAPHKRFEIAQEKWHKGLDVIKKGKVVEALLGEHVETSTALGKSHGLHDRKSMHSRHGAKRGTHCGDVTDIMRRIKEHGADSKKKSVHSSKSLDRLSKAPSKLLLSMEPDANDIADGRILVEDFKMERRKHQELPPDRIAPKLVGECPDMPLQDCQDEMMKLVQDEEPDPKILRAVTGAFLAVVRSEYWLMIEHGDFFANEADQVLRSVTEALSANSIDLNDFSYIEPFIQCNFIESNGRMSVAAAITKVKTDGKTKEDSALHKFTDSAPFNGTIALMIVANSILTIVEQQTGPEGNEKKAVGWVILEIFFTIVFLAEFMLKFADLKLQYFFDASNCFDFVLVVLGIIGCVCTVILFAEPASDNSSEGSGEGLARIVKVFRMLRIVRVFRLYRVVHTLQFKFRRTSKLALEISEHMQKISVLTNFSRAHMKSQEKLVRFFGRSSRVDMVEVARCILQSQTSVYKALTMAEQETRVLDSGLLNECSIAEENRSVAEDCEKFIVGAMDDGVITHHEGEEFLHTIHHHIQKFLHRIHDAHSGKLSCNIQLRGSVESEVDFDGEFTQAMEIFATTSKRDTSPSASRLRAEEPEKGNLTRSSSPGPPDMNLEAQKSEDKASPQMSAGVQSMSMGMKKHANTTAFDFNSSKTEGELPPSILGRQSEQVVEMTATDAGEKNSHGSGRKKVKKFTPGATSPNLGESASADENPAAKRASRPQSSPPDGAKKGWKDKSTGSTPKPKKAS